MDSKAFESPLPKRASFQSRPSEKKVTSCKKRDLKKSDSPPSSKHSTPNTCCEIDQDTMEFIQEAYHCYTNAIAGVCPDSEVPESKQEFSQAKTQHDLEILDNFY